LYIYKPTGGYVAIYRIISHFSPLKLFNERHWLSLGV